MGMGVVHMILDELAVVLLEQLRILHGVVVSAPQMEAANG